ncbi:hypothetical protein OG21DRAFT_1491134 [Imleria badia]|nr:hypothetical protein OG21DRAFT_1491134 [Imleria badia]
MITAVLNFLANIFALILLLGVFLIIWTTPFSQPVTFEFYCRDNAFGIIIIHQDRAEALLIPEPEPATEEDPWANWAEEDQQWAAEDKQKSQFKPGKQRTPIGISQLHTMLGMVKEEFTQLGQLGVGKYPCPTDKAIVGQIHLLTISD